MTATPERSIERRALMKGAAWSVPVVAVAASTPLAAASTTPLPPGVTVDSGNGPWTDHGDFDGWIADGVSVTVADENGRPLAGIAVSLTFGSGWKRNNFWFVEDPDLNARAARERSNQKGSITLITDENGVLNLNDGSSGYLRKGSNGERNGVYLVVTAGGQTQQVLLVNSSSGGGRNPGILPGS